MNRYNYSGFDVSDDCQDYIIEYATEVGDAESGPFVSESSILISAMNEEEAEEIAEKMLGNEEDVIGYKVRLATKEDMDNYYDSAYDNVEIDDEFENAPGWGVETESLNEAISWNDLTWAEQFVADRVLNDIKYEQVSTDEEDIISYIYTIASDAEYECPEDEEFICDDEKVLDYILDHLDMNESLKEGVNWREIKATLDNDKVDEVVRNISNIMNNAAEKNGLKCYLYRKKYRENWNSLLYMIFKTWDDETLLNDKHYSNGDYDDETEKYIKSTLKPVLMDIKKNIPEVSSVGFVRGNDCGNVLGYINLPYENFTLN